MSAPELAERFIHVDRHHCQCCHQASAVVTDVTKRIIRPALVLCNMMTRLIGFVLENQSNGIHHLILQDESDKTGHYVAHGWKIA